MNGVVGSIRLLPTPAVILPILCILSRNAPASVRHARTKRRTTARRLTNAASLFTRDQRGAPTGPERKNDQGVSGTAPGCVPSTKYSG